MKNMDSSKEANDTIVQYIVVNKGLNMSAGKLAAQVSHASMAFLAHAVTAGIDRDEQGHNTVIETIDGKQIYHCDMLFNKRIVDDWIGGIFTKIVLEVKSETKLMHVIGAAQSAGLVEGRDFFPIRDACLTELQPDETGSRLTCVGFAPMPKSKMHDVVGKLQLYHG